MTNNIILIFRLAELMLEKEQHILQLDDLFDDEEVGSFTRSIQIDSPYQQLIFEGVLTETIKNGSVIVTFTVEGYFHYVLGKLIEKRCKGKGAEAFKKLLENNTLRGVTEGVEQCLLRDVEKNELSRLMSLINEGGKALKACTYPLAQAFLIIQDHAETENEKEAASKKQIQRVIDELLKDSTDNDIKILGKAIAKLKENQKLDVIKKIYIIISKKIKPKSYNQNKLLISSLEYIPKAERIELLNILKNKIIKNGDIKLINQLLFHFKLNGKSSSGISIINENKKIKLGNNLLGLLYSDVGNYEMSIKYYKKEISKIKSSEKRSEKSLGMLYNNIGSNYLRSKKINEGMGYLKKSIIISEKFYGKYHPSTASAFINLGNALIQKRSFNDVILLNNKAKKIFTNIYGKNHRSMIYINNNISDAYLALNQPLKALKHQEKSYQICNDYFGLDHHETGTCYNKIGFIYIKLKDLNSAEKYHRKSLETYEKILPDKHPFIQIAKDTLTHTLKLDD